MPPATSSFTHMGQETRHATGHVLRGDEPDVLLGKDTEAVAEPSHP